MTVKAKSNGKVSPETLKLSIDPTWGAYKEYLKVQVAIFEADQAEGGRGMIEAIDLINDWLLKYGGVPQEVLDTLSYPDVRAAIRQAQSVFGGVDIPKQKSAT